MVIARGENPNAFTLLDQDGKDVAISDFDQSFKLLSFHPLAWTGVCTGQVQDLENNYEKFREMNIIPFEISVDPVPTKKAWAEHLGLEELTLLSDFYPLGFAARMLNIFLKTEGISGRANILMDQLGEIVWSREYEISQKPDVNEVLAACEVEIK
ncbi:MAG: redoxin domain-containing protein [Bacillota bacterium]